MPPTIATTDDPTTMNSAHHQTTLSYLLSGKGLASGNKDVLKAICIALAEDAQGTGSLQKACTMQAQEDTADADNGD